MSILDRRSSNNNSSSNNRDRYLKRVRDKIKKAMPDIVSGEAIKDITKGNGNIKVPIKDTREPQFRYSSKSGKRDRVVPGNKDYFKGDTIEKEYDGGSGRGSKGSKDAENFEEDFAVIISREEFLKYFFEDLQLPNLIKESLQRIKKTKLQRTGYTVDGPHNRLNIPQSFKKSLGRRIGVGASLKKKIEELEALLAVETDDTKRITLQAEIDKLTNRLKSIVFIDDVDLRYNNFEIRTLPTTRALMVCIMDVSGSMTYEHKDIAKRFFMLLYLFLQHNYEEVEIVFIRHTTEAQEVDEKTFFESRESGGTEVLPALKLMNKIIEDRYHSDWNIYCCQASDGDVWDASDATLCRLEVEDTLLPKMQYMAYIDIRHDAYERTSQLYKEYNKIDSLKFTNKIITDVTEIWTVFRKLFEKD